MQLRTEELIHVITPVYVNGFIFEVNLHDCNGRHHVSIQAAHRHNLTSNARSTLKAISDDYDRESRMQREGLDAGHVKFQNAYIEISQAFAAMKKSNQRYSTHVARCDGSFEDLLVSGALRGDSLKASAAFAKAKATMASVIERWR